MQPTLFLIIYFIASTGKLHAAETAWEKAIREGDSKEIGKLCAIRTGINQPSVLGSTPLHYAAGMRKYEKDPDALIVEQLLDAGADVDQANLLGRTALMIAARNLDNKTVLILLKRGARIDAQDMLGYTALMAAIDARTTSSPSESVTPTHICCEYLLDYCVSQDTKDMTHVILEMKDAQGDNALCYAINNKKIDVAQLLLQRGADVCSPGHNGMTPLMLACKIGSISLIELLLAQGADPKQTGPQNTTAIFFAVESDNIVAARLLIKAGAECDCFDEQHNSLLHSVQSFEMIELLLSHSAHLDVVNNHKQTPLHTAANACVAQALINKRLSMKSLDDRRATPLFYARNDGIVRLLACGDSLHKRNVDGETPLISLLKRYNEKKCELSAIQACINLGASLFDADYSGTTALAYARAMNIPLVRARAKSRLQSKLSL